MREPRLHGAIARLEAASRNLKSVKSRTAAAAGLQQKRRPEAKAFGRPLAGLQMALFDWEMRENRVYKCL